MYVETNNDIFKKYYSNSVVRIVKKKNNNKTIYLILVLSRQFEMFEYTAVGTRQQVPNLLYL